MGHHFTRPSRAEVQARVALVAPLVAEGLPYAEIARRTGISPQWISDWARRPRAAAHQRLRGRDDRARVALDTRRVAAMKAYDAGMLQAEIARRWQVSAVSVHRWVNAWRGRDDRARTALEARRVAAMQAYADGMPQAEIARRWEVSAMAVSRWVKALTTGGADALQRAATTGRPPRKATP